MSWKKMKLAECCLSVADGDHQPPPKTDKGIPFVTISNINANNQFDFSNTMFVSEDYYEKLDDKRKAKSGDVLYSVVGSFGIPIYIKDDTKFVFQRHIAILRPNEKILSKFLYYTMLSDNFYAKADAVAIGAAQRTISLTALRNIEIDIPKIQEQERVVKILSAYDDLIENNQKQIKLLEEAAQRLYKEWFVELSFPGCENMPIINGVPQGWRLDEVKSVVSLLSGYAFKSSSFVDNGKYKIVTIKNVQDGNFDGENVNSIAEIPSKIPTHCILNDGDILLSLTGNVGRICLVNGENYLLNQRVAKLNSKYPAYSYCLFRSKEMFDAMNNLANGAAQQNLSPIKTENMRILIPNDELIKTFENIVSPMIGKILFLNKSNGDLKQARDRLLPKLMSGELEV